MSSINIRNENSTFEHNPNHQFQNLNHQGKKRKVTKKNTECNSNLKRYPAPVFNIHVHVPFFQTKNASIYIPPIQPVVHIHVDDFHKQIGFDKNIVTVKTLKKAVKNMFRTSPKIGQVRIHVGKKVKTISKNVIPNNDPVPSTSERVIHDTAQNLNNGIVQSSISIVRNTDNRPKTQKKYDDHNYTKKKCFKNWFVNDKKLNNAVVVLTDIRKDKYYKKLFDTESNGSILIQNNENNDNNEPNINLNELNNVVVIKTEPITNELENNYQYSENNFVNNLSNGEVKFQKYNSVTDLADGCDFSEILCRFKAGKNFEKKTTCACDEPVLNIEFGMVKSEEISSDEINSNHINGLNMSHEDLKENEISLGRNSELDGSQISNPSFLNYSINNESQAFCNPFSPSDTSTMLKTLVIEEKDPLSV